MTVWQLSLSLLPDQYAISRLEATMALPSWVSSTAFSSITRTADELSIVCREDDLPADIPAERGWRCLKVEGPFDLSSAIGVLAALATPLASSGIGIFVVSTYDTDYLLVKDQQLDQATLALSAAGHRIL